MPKPDRVKYLMEQIQEDNILGIGRVIPVQAQMQNKPTLALRVAHIIKEQMECGALDDTCTREEIELIEEFIHTTFIHGGE